MDLCSSSALNQKLQWFFNHVKFYRYNNRGTPGLCFGPTSFFGTVARKSKTLKLKNYFEFFLSDSMFFSNVWPSLVFGWRLRRAGVWECNWHQTKAEQNVPCCYIQQPWEAEIMWLAAYANTQQKNMLMWQIFLTSGKDNFFFPEISPSSENWDWSAVQIPARLTCYVWTVCGCRGTTPWLRQPGRRCNNPAGFSDVLELPIGQTQRTWCFWWQQSSPEPRERLFN